MKAELEYRLGEHGFFPELVRMVTTISGVALAVEAFSAGVARPHRTPDFVVLEGRAGLSDVEMQLRPIHVSKLQLLLARLVGDAFVSYFERHADAVVARWGKERLGQWPMLWRFGRAVSNALVHNGCIHFTSSASPAVEWHGLRYGFGDNGRPVLFKELRGVELVLLTEEMDAYLRRVRGGGPQRP
jgi:hypothetical protein